MTAPAGVNPLLAGLRGRCPLCGQGRLFQGLLGIVPACAACGFDLAHADSGDGPAVLCLALLRPLKGLMIAAQIRNKASEHRRDGAA